MSNPSVSVRPALSGKQPSLALLFSQMVAAFERSQTARADRIIRRFSYLGARLPEDKQNTAGMSKPAAAVRYRSLTVGISP